MSDQKKNKVRKVVLIKKSSDKKDSSKKSIREESTQNIENEELKNDNLFNEELKKDESTVEIDSKDKKKKKKKHLTKDQKKKKRRKRRIIWGSVLGCLILAWGTVAITTKVGQSALLSSLEAVKPVDYEGTNVIKPVLDKDGKPVLDENGSFTFVDTKDELSKRNFRVLQLTDVHIGAGAFSLREDSWTIRTVTDLVQKVKPDLVVTTGDIAYPVWPQSGTLDNLKEAMVYANLMEKLGVYWTFSFGNHDTEAYSFYNRDEIAKFYDNKDEFPHCLFTSQAKKVDGKKVRGAGNFTINLKDHNEELVHSLFMVDSNMYMEDDPLGAKWHYDYIHEDQIKWYEEESKKLGLSKDNNKAKSTMYFHIPVKEYSTVYHEWLENDKKDSDTIKLINGIVGEDGRGALGTNVQTDIIDKCVEYGTTGMFCGHDHLNNSSYLYDKDGFDKGNPGIKLTYGMSIDYLAYPGIYKKVAQRGGRMIEINAPGKIKESKQMKEKFTDSYKLDLDQEFGFTTYNIPYWQDLYQNKTVDNTEASK